MKRKLYIFILLILSCFLLISCNKDLSEKSEKQIINTLEREYLKQYVKEEYPWANRSWIIFSKYYGEYNNAYIMAFKVKGVIYTTDLPVEEIEGYKFWFSSIRPLVYKDGTFYGFKQAYDIGILTIEDIKELYDNMYT